MPTTVASIGRKRKEGASSVRTVNVKWKREHFLSLEIDTDQPVLKFKSQLFDLTGVPPQRQKIVLKERLLKDDSDLAKIDVEDGQKLLMVGTADVLPQGPEENPTLGPVDLSKEIERSLRAGYTKGLWNRGNHCYANSTLQCLYSVPELKSALQQYTTSNSTEIDDVTLAIRNIFAELEFSFYPVDIEIFMRVLRREFPQFDIRDSTGMHVQKDAEECWTQLVRNLSRALCTQADEHTPAVDIMNHLFGIGLQSISKCTESEEKSVKMETVYILKCSISFKVHDPMEGLINGLFSFREKVSPALGRSARFERASLIIRLPLYLTVQFDRFCGHRESGKAKILRKLDCPLVLDVLEICSAAMKDQLMLFRKRVEEIEYAEAGFKELKGKDDLQDVTGVPSSSSEDAGQVSVSSEPQPTGIYDLVSILTHKGLSVDSGHYTAWVKLESGEWIELDDEIEPILHTEDEVSELCGGGSDQHMAYICLYKARVAPKKILNHL